MRLLSSVTTQMLSQITLGRKSLGTYAAFVRLLTSVAAIVYGQMLFAVGVIGAVFALKPLGVVAMLRLKAISN